MALKKNIISSYVGQFYVTALGLLIVPTYIEYMGAEAYGLVGFFAMLQACFNLLDLGLGPTLAREAARIRGGAASVVEHLRLMRTLNIIFLVIAMVGGSVLFLMADKIAIEWLKGILLSHKAISRSIELISLVVALRWISGLYRAYISGAESFVWLNSYNSFIATLRFFGVLPLLIYFDNSPVAFFIYQALVAVIEVLGLFVKSRTLLPLCPNRSEIGWNLRLLVASTKGVLNFSMGIAFTSSVWVLVTQLDKLVLSKILPLADYGYFTLAVLAASGVMMISGPLSNAVNPRITFLHANGAIESVFQVYRATTQMVVVLAIPACMMLAFFPYETLMVWTNDSSAAGKAANVLVLYALGNGFLVVASLPLLLQYASGNIRLHVVGNICYVLILIPSILYGAIYHGMIGAGYAWLVANLFSFVIWTAVVHAKFMPKKHFRWLVDDVGVSASLACTFALIFKFNYDWPTGRIESFVTLVIMGLVLVFISSLGSSVVRDRVFKKSI